MRILAAAATLVAGAALASVLAYWGWRLLGPSAVHIPASGPANPAATLVASNLFGDAGAAAGGVAPPSALFGADSRLLGIIAENGERGYALIRLASGPKLVAQGDSISPGVTLVAVHRDAVTIRDGAGERRYPLRSDVSKPPGTPPAAPGARVAPTPARTAQSAACGPPAGFRGTLVRLNTEWLSGIGPDGAQWRTLLAPVEGGLVVREDNGFGAMLGLKAGDRLTQANGIALGVPEDVTAAIVRPLVANQGVRLIGSRSGATQELWLANVACAG